MKKIRTINDITMADWEDIKRRREAGASLDQVGELYGIPLGDLVDTFTDIPAADVAPVRRGRWIEEDGIQICSECGEEHEWGDYRAPYCDTCGAKMNKEDV